MTEPIQPSSLPEVVASLEERIEIAIDEALEATFPASDPVPFYQRAATPRAPVRATSDE